MTTKRRRRRADIDIFSMSAAPEKPAPTISSLRTPRKLSVLQSPTVQGKMTSGERIRLLNRENAKRLEKFRAERQKREREKAEREKAERKMLARRNVHVHNSVWDLTKDNEYHVGTVKAEDEGLVSEDEDDVHFAQLQACRELSSSPNDSNKARAYQEDTQPNASRKRVQTSVVEVVDDDNSPAPSRLKKRRAQRKRVGISVNNPVFAPDAKSALAKRFHEERRLNESRRPLRNVNGRRPITPPRIAPVSRTLDEEFDRDTPLRSRSPSKCDSAPPSDTGLSLDISAIPGFPRDIDTVVEISDDDDDAVEPKPNPSGDNVPKSSKGQRIEKKHTKRISTTNFYGNGVRLGTHSRVPYHPTLGPLVIPRSKTRALEPPTREVENISLKDRPLAPLTGGLHSTEKPVNDRRRSQRRVKYTSDEDEDSTGGTEVLDIRFRPLDKDELSLLGSLTFKIPKQRIMARIPEANIDLKAGDFSGLRGSRWLNDEVINSFVALINARNKAQVQCSPERLDTGQGESGNDEEIVEVTVTSSKPMEVFRRPRPRVHVFNTFFFSRLSQGGYDYNGVRRWLKRAGRGVKELDLIMFPINLSNYHWVLAAIDLRGKHFLYFDSTYGGDSCGIIPLLRRWLVDEVKDKNGEGQAREMKIESWGAIVNPQYLPRQQDGGSCGVFTLYMAEYLERGKRPDFTQANIRTLRQRTALFLKRGKLPED